MFVGILLSGHFGLLIDIDGDAFTKVNDDPVFVEMVPNSGETPPPWTRPKKVRPPETDDG